MLSYEALTAQAKLRGMPPSKMRGLLREYLQVLILKQLGQLDKDGRLYFTGGTYLRLVHNFKRFSEDLDFYTKGITTKAFGEITKKIAGEMKRMGCECQLVFAHRSELLVALFIFPVIEGSYGITSPHSKKKGGIVIKFEANQPQWKIRNESELINGFGELFPCRCSQKGALMADKIDAVIKKSRGRHLYDMIRMLSAGFPIDLSVWKKLGKGTNALEALLDKVDNISNSELKRQAEQLRPFLFNEEEANLVIQAKQVLVALLKSPGLIPLE